MNTTLLLLGLWGGCQASDFATTHVALHSGHFYEGNAVMRGPHLYAFKASINVGVFIWKQKAPKASHADVILPVAMAISGCAAGTWNLHQLSKR